MAYRSRGQRVAAVSSRRPEPLSRRPHRLRKRQWTSALARAIEELRNDNPMWGKRKIAVLLRREGVKISISTIGRIHAHLVRRGAVLAVPVLRRRPTAKRTLGVGPQPA